MTAGGRPRQETLRCEHCGETFTCDDELDALHEAVMDHLREKHPDRPKWQKQAQRAYEAALKESPRFLAGARQSY